jgi:selenocysteine lyase/cysteine desulfurase
LGAGIRFVESADASVDSERAAVLAQRLSRGLRDIERVSVFCDPQPRTGVVSFLIARGNVSVTGTILDEAFGIAVRTGLHCAPAAHQAIGTLPEGTVRASFGRFNTAEDADALVEAVRQIARKS